MDVASVSPSKSSRDMLEKLPKVRNFNFFFFSVVQRLTCVVLQPVIPKSLKKGDVNILQLDPLEIARQLSLIDFNLFNALRPRVR